MEEKEFRYVSGSEQDQVPRALLDWLNEYQNFSNRVRAIEKEYLSNSTSMGLFTTVSAYKTAEYISGAYEAQYQFAIQYRISTSNTNQRLGAEESLNDIAAWAERRFGLLGEAPYLGQGKKVTSIERSSPAVMISRYDDGNEDYQILMVMTYEVRSA
ncbi:MAG: hypothetical protein HP058_03710 [Massilimaliae sp.]|nr:hypothetical protein [Massiliimalia sp.]